MNNMRELRTLTFGLVALSLAAGASAQFDGPAPLAWRWLQPTRVPPAGSPLVSGDTIYTAVGSRVFSLDRTTGNLKWRFPAVDPIPGAFRSAPILVGDVLVAAGDNKIVYGIDPTTGENRWAFTSPSSIIGQPVQAGRFVAFATSDDRLITIDPATGQQGWTAPYRIFDGITGSLGSVNNEILVFTRKNELLAINVNDPKTTWKQRFAQLPAGARPVVQDNAIYLTSGPYLIALNGISGTAKWQVATGEQLTLAPAVSTSGVLALTQDGEALVYDLNGRPRNHTEKVKERTVSTNRIPLGSFALVQPTAVGDKFIVPTTNGAINLVDPASGTVLWSYLVRPIGNPTTAEPPAQRGPGGNDTGGPAGGPSGGGIQSAPKTPEKILTIQASGPAVLSGTTLLVPARDGSILAFSKELGVDLTSPEVKMLWPRPGEQFSGQPPLMFIFNIEDEAAGINPSTLKIEIDGQAQEHTFGRDGVASVRISVSGPNRPLIDGRRTLTVTVSDWLGNETKKEFSLSIDNTLPPLAPPAPPKSEDRGGRGPGGGPGLGGGGG